MQRTHWELLESRVAASSTHLLKLLDEHRAKATFFILGWVAERHPELVRSVVEAGHEVASHGWDHRRVTEQTPEEFRDSARRTKQLLEDLTGVPVIGYRAPSFSIVPGCEWALDILLEEGYGYDSSLFPVKRSGYGYPNGQRDIHRLELEHGSLAEVPPATFRFWGMNLPAGGGAYFRLLPYRFVSATLREYERRSTPATFYIHPWEIDPGQPRLDVPWLTRLRHYSGLRTNAARLTRLLKEFRFTSISETLDAQKLLPVAPK